MTFQKQACRVCLHPRRAEIDAALLKLDTPTKGWLMIRTLTSAEPPDVRPGRPVSMKHYTSGHHFGGDTAFTPSEDDIAAKARRILNDKLDSLPAKDLKDIVLQNMKTTEAREKTKQLLAAKKAKDDGDDPNRDAMEAAAMALGHRKARLAVVGNLRSPNERASG